MNRVWQWTQGHPYFTQLLCSEIWEAAYDDKPTKAPTVMGDDVEDAVADALEQGANAFQWIWNGLPSAERIVMAAMAEERTEVISQHLLTELLNRSGVRLILRELELAPETLEKWDLLRRVVNENQSDTDDQDVRYRFAIPLLKRWVQENKPLRRVKAELDSIEPLAVNLYQSAAGIYALNDLDGAEGLLTRALDINPNHMQSRLLLGRVQLGQGNPNAAVTTLEPVYEFDPFMGRHDLVAALLARAESEADSDQQILAYTRILEIEPDQPVAKKAWTTIWTQKAEEALKTEEYTIALDAYQQMDDEEAVNRVLTLQSKAQLTHFVHTAEEHEKAEQWSEAVDIYTQLLTEFPDEEDLQQRLARATEESDLATLYTQALGLIQEKKMDAVATLLAQVIGRRPDYKESARYLLISLHGDDVMALKENLAALTRQKDRLQQKLDAVATTSNVLAAKRKTAFWNPINYLRLFWWMLIRPKSFKNFRAALNTGQTEQLTYLAAWTSSTLSWGALSCYAAWGVAQGSLLQTSPVIVYAIYVIMILAWFLTGRYGHLKESDTAGALGIAIVFVVTVAYALSSANTGTIAFACAGVIANVSAGVIANAGADKSVYWKTDTGAGAFAKIGASIFTIAIPALVVTAGGVNIVTGIVAAFVALLTVFGVSRWLTSRVY
ncbi:tetratricopeptide repeat protein [Chloroflexi bacterium TSY]|nr:tetratricopeptide repeat protein [Chloroflexi bacterium TSY]